MGKRLFMVVMLLCLFSCSCSSSALSVPCGDETISLDFPEGYSVVTRESFQIDSWSENLPLSKSEMEKRFDDEGLLADAFDPESGREIKLTVREDELSKAAFRLSGLSDEKCRQVLANLTEGLEKTGYTTVTSSSLLRDGKTSLLCYSAQVGKVENGYSYIAFAAVENGRTYELTFYSNGHVLTESQRAEAQATAKTLSVKQTTPIPVPKWLVVIGFVCIASVVIFGILLIISFIRDIWIGLHKNTDLK